MHIFGWHMCILFLYTSGWRGCMIEAPDMFKKCSLMNISRWKRSDWLHLAKEQEDVSEHTHWRLRVLVGRWHTTPVLAPFWPANRLYYAYERRRDDAATGVAFQESRRNFPISSHRGETAQGRSSLLVFLDCSRTKQQNRQRQGTRKGMPLQWHLKVH